MNAVRSFGPIGKALRDAASRVPAQQVAYGVKKHAATYANGASDSLVLNATWAVAGVSTLFAVKGIKDMLFGTGKKAV